MSSGFRASQKIKILTIDRSKEKNLDYLNLYYNNIEKHSKNLLIFKSIDKLDNLLIGDKYLFNNYSLNLLKILIRSSHQKLKQYLIIKIIFNI